MFGLLGAHRTGKTTLAKLAAENLNLSFCETSVSEFLARQGATARQDMSFEERLALQDGVLGWLEERYRSCGRAFIADRTPLDVVAYTMAEIGRNTLAEIGVEKFNQHFARAAEITRTYFEQILIVQPGIPLIDDASKAPACPAYIEHLNALMIGLGHTVSGVDVAVIPREIIDLNARGRVAGKLFLTKISSVPASVTVH